MEVPVIKLEKKELTYATLGALFTILWFYLLSGFIASYLSSIPPFIAMLLYSSGLFLGILGLSSILDKTGFRWRMLILSYSIIIGIGIISAPYLVSSTGIINTTAEYWYVSADVGFASLWTAIVPLNMVWFMTYIFSPTLLIFVIPIIMASSKQIARVLK